MTKPDWKTKPHERKRMTLQQENAELKKRLEALASKIEVLDYEKHHQAESIKYFRDERDALEGDANRYRVLRTKDVMVLDGEPKYLKGEDLDKYCDVEKDKLWGVSLTSMSSFRQQVAQASTFRLNPTNMFVPMNVADQAEKILKENNYGNDAGSESKEADSKDSGHHTDILRYADWNGLWKQWRA